MDASRHIINLLPHADELSRRRRKIARIVDGAFIAVMAGLGLTVLAFRSASLLTNRSLSSLEQQISAQQQVLADQSEKEQQYQLLTQRVKEASAVLSNRQSIYDRVQRVVDAVPADVYLVELKTGNSGSSIDAVFASSSLSGLEHMMAMLESSEYPEILFRGGSRTVEGTYRFGVTLSYR